MSSNLIINNLFTCLWLVVPFWIRKLPKRRHDGQCTFKNERLTIGENMSDLFPVIFTENWNNQSDIDNIIINLEGKTVFFVLEALTFENNRCSLAMQKNMEVVRKQWLFTFSMAYNSPLSFRTDLWMQNWT